MVYTKKNGAKKTVWKTMKRLQGWSHLGSTFLLSKDDFKVALYIYQNRMEDGIHSYHRYLETLEKPYYSALINFIDIFVAVDNKWASMQYVLISRGSIVRHIGNRCMYLHHKPGYVYNKQSRSHGLDFHH